MDYVVFNNADGESVKGGSISDASQLAIQAGEGQTAVIVPPGTLAWPGIDLTPLRAQMSAAVDVAAGAFRSQFITVTPGQEATYIYKANEARAWTADNSAPTPLLSPEAAARNMTIAALAAEVLANESAWLQLGGKIEGARMGAKTAIAAATNIGGVVAAATVNWQALTAPPASS